MAAQGGNQSPHSLKLYDWHGHCPCVRVCQRHPAPHTHTRVTVSTGTSCQCLCRVPVKKQFSVFTKEVEGRITFMAYYLIRERNLNR